MLPAQGRQTSRGGASDVWEGSSVTDATAGEPQRRGRGRPRDAALQQRIKDAALGVLATHGFSGLTLERVCAEAGIPKATFYRRWENPTACVVEAYLEIWSEAEFRDTGDAPGDLEAFARKLMQLYGHPKLGPVSMAIQAEFRVRAEFHDLVQSGALRRRGKNTAAVEQALGRLSTPPAMSANMILDVLNGVIRNIQSLEWPLAEDDLRQLIKVLLTPADRAGPA